MISFEEMLHGHNADDFSEDIQENMRTLLNKVNVIRAAWGKPMTVTSGVRTQSDQLKINPKAPKSNHLTGHAIDIYDPGLKLTAWLKSDEGAPLLVQQGLYCEAGNSDWVHFQDIRPGSGNRWFLP